MIKLKTPSIKLLFLLNTIFISYINCQQQTQKPINHNKYEKAFTTVIIIGGYVAILIGAIIFRLQARQSKVVQFQQVGARGISSTQHKFQQLQEQIQSSSVKKTNMADYQSTAGDSTKRKRRKRKADRLSDRRKNNQSNQSQQNNNEEGQD